MKKLLITGASGFLGWNLCNKAHSEWNVVACVNSRTVAIPGIETVQCDLTNPHSVKQLFEQINPDAVIHAAAAAQPNWCQAHPAESSAINVAASIEIAARCADRSIPCAFTSTDLVFDGTAAPYTEDAPVRPLSLYGEQKVAAEQGMRDRWPGVTICRMPLMFGNPGPNAQSYLQPLIAGLRAGKEQKLFTDEFRTTVSGATAASGILLLLAQGVSGTFHLGGRERISRYDFGVMVAAMTGCDFSLVKPIRQKELAMEAPRPADVSLDSSKAFRLGYKPDILRNELHAVLASFSRGS